MSFIWLGEKISLNIYLSADILKFCFQAFEPILENSMNEIPQRLDFGLSTDLWTKLDFWTDFWEMKSPRIGGCIVYEALRSTWKLNFKLGIIVNLTKFFSNVLNGKFQLLKMLVIRRILWSSQRLKIKLPVIRSNSVSWPFLC